MYSSADTSITVSLLAAILFVCAGASRVDTIRPSPPDGLVWEEENRGIKAFEVSFPHQHTLPHCDISNSLEVNPYTEYNVPAERPIRPALEVPDNFGELHPIETDELVTSKLQELDRSVSKISNKRKKCLLQAQERCPKLLTDDFKLMFLRCDLFDAEEAAARYVTYWNKRVEIFGPDAAFQPLTLETMDNTSDKIAREMGVYNVFEANGRMVAFELPRRYSLKGTSRESYVKAYWYLVHSVLEHEETQKRGMIVLNDPNGVNLRKQQDLKFMKMVSSLKDALPVRVSAYHILQPPAFVKRFLPLFDIVLGESLKKRILIHTGTREEIFKRLSRYGFNRQDLPKEIGGDRTIDMKAFFDRRQSTGL